VRLHLGRHPRYKHRLTGSSELARQWQDHRTLPEDVAQDQEAQLEWLCDICKTVAKHKNMCTKSLREEAQKATRARWDKVRLDELQMAAAAKRLEIEQAQAARAAAALAAGQLTGSSGRDGDGDTAAARMQDADQEDAEERILLALRTAEADMLAEQSAAAAGNVDAGLPADREGVEAADCAGDSDGTSSDEEDEEDGEDAAAPQPEPDVPDSSVEGMSKMLDYIAKRKSQFPIQHNNAVSLSGDWTRKFTHVREFFPSFPLKLTASTPLQLLLQHATLCWLDPGLFFRAIWDPKTLKCPQCNECGCADRPIQRLGFDSRPRVCCRLDGTIEFVVVVRWKHAGCSKKKGNYDSVVFSALHPNVYAQFPGPVQNAYGFVARSRGVLVTTRFVRTINALMVSGTSAAAVARVHQDAVQNILMEAELLQRELYKATSANPGSLRFRAAPLTLPVGVCQLFARSVFGFSLSAKRVLALVREDSERTEPYFLAYNGAIRAKVLALDHTFKVAKCVQLALPGKRRVSLFSAVLLVTNEFGQVCAYFFANSKSLKACATGLKGAYDRVVANNGPDDKIVAVFSDQPDKDERTLRDILGEPELKVLLDVYHAIHDLSTVAPAKHPYYRPYVRELSEAFMHRVDVDVALVMAKLREHDDRERTRQGLMAMTDAEKDARETRLHRTIQGSRRRFQHSIRRITPERTVMKTSLQAIQAKYSVSELLKPGAAKKFQSMYKKIAAGYVSDQPLVEANLRHKNIGTADNPHYLSLSTTSKQESVHRYLNKTVMGTNNMSTFTIKMLKAVTYSNMQKERIATMGPRSGAWKTVEFPLVSRLAQYHGPTGFPEGHPLHKFPVTTPSVDAATQRSLASQFGCEGNGVTSQLSVRQAMARFAIDIHEGGVEGSTAAAVQAAARLHGAHFLQVDRLDGRAFAELVVESLHRHGHDDISVVDDVHGSLCVGPRFTPPVLTISERRLFSHLLLGQIRQLQRKPNPGQVETELLRLWLNRDETESPPLQLLPFWEGLANRKTKLLNAFDFGQMEHTWNALFLTGCWDGSIRVTNDLILPLRDVGAKFSSSLKEFGSKLAHEYVNRVMVPSLDSFAGHVGPPGTVVVESEDGATAARVDGVQGIGVDALLAAPATVGAPTAATCFRAGPTTRVSDPAPHPHSQPRSTKYCSGCQAIRQCGPFHENNCPVRYLLVEDDDRIPAARLIRTVGSRDSKSRGIAADDIYYFMSADEKQAVCVAAAQAAVSAQPPKRRRLIHQNFAHGHGNRSSDDSGGSSSEDSSSEGSSDDSDGGVE
jgi:hypothetical protein